eukprot:scpid110905/ scgid4245/ 
MVEAFITRSEELGKETPAVNEMEAEESSLDLSFSSDSISLEDILDAAFAEARAANAMRAMNDTLSGESTSDLSCVEEESGPQLCRRGRPTFLQLLLLLLLLLFLLLLLLLLLP